MKKKLILFTFLSVLVLALTGPAMAQIPGVPSYDPGTVDLILAGIGGLTVLGLTQMVKTWLKASGALAILISLAVSGAATAYYLVRAGTFSVIAFIGYTLFIFLAANGIYKATKTG